MPLREKALIARIRRQSRVWPGTVHGIGDDCAVLHPSSNHEVLLTTDCSLEGVHFHRKWQPPESVGHRCLARGLSDIAAMGGKPLAAFLSLALPKGLPQKWADGFFRGLLTLADSYKVTLAGGDVAQSPSGILADIVVAGEVPRGQAILRSKARPGDLIYVTGELGGSAETLYRLMRGQKLDPKNHGRHFFPEPRLRIGKFLRERKLATAMIDVSDGLSTDLAHICDESSVGATLLASAIPPATVGKEEQIVGLDLALHGGEDYELLFTAKPDAKIPRRISGVAITGIGQITANRGMTLVNKKKTRVLKPQGWEHFSS